MEEKTMMTKELVTYVAELSRISLNEMEIEKMQDELGAVVAYMDILNSLDTTEIAFEIHRNSGIMIASALHLLLYSICCR